MSGRKYCAGGENGLDVGEDTANVDRIEARLERDERHNEQNSDWRDEMSAGQVDG
jgi:hypothetical protein